MQKRWATASKTISLHKPILQRTATPGNGCRRIVALEKDAGSSPVGHPPVFRIGKLNPQNRDAVWCPCREFLTPPRWGEPLL
jgi:hypothetical protein